MLRADSGPRPVQIRPRPSIYGTLLRVRLSAGLGVTVEPVTQADEQRRWQ